MVKYTDDLIKFVIIEVSSVYLTISAYMLNIRTITSSHWRLIWMILIYNIIYEGMEVQSSQIIFRHNYVISANQIMLYCK